MSRTTMRRLDRLEGSLVPVLGQMYVIYARDVADFEAQRAGLIASRRAMASDFIMDWNYGLPVAQHDSGEPESLPVTRTHEEWVDILAREERPQ